MTNSPLTLSQPEIQKRKRINVALWAYAYEIMDDPLVPDSKFDQTCLEIDTSISTDDPICDEFFCTHFSPHTGSWVHKHPDPEGLRQIYSKLRGKIGKSISKSCEIKKYAKVEKQKDFECITLGKIYIASLGFCVLPHTLHNTLYGPIDFDFDRDWFTVTQQQTGIQKTILYKDFYSRSKP